jgi:hypothetical protein
MIFPVVGFENVGKLQIRSAAPARRPAAISIRPLRAEHGQQHRYAVARAHARVEPVEAGERSLSDQPAKCPDQEIARLIALADPGGSGALPSFVRTLGVKISKPRWATHSAARRS